MTHHNEAILGMLAAALEKEEKGRDFYKKASETCADQLGKDMFKTLMVEEGAHISRIKEIYSEIQGGKSWSDQWKKFKIENPDLDKLFHERMQKIGPRVKGQTGDIEALSIGVDMEQGAIKFYEESLSKASDAMEKEFCELMILEERKHFKALQDLKLYLQDPESWFAELERHGYDG
ncbi:MAG: ferritin family protein [Desulfomonilaceae bacterium]